MKFFEQIHYAVNNVEVTGHANGMWDALSRLHAAINGVQKSGKKTILIGNGGSAAIASHIAQDYTKYGWRSIAFNDAALLTCFANDFGHEDAFSEMIRRYADPGDLLIAISSSGQSKNILNAAAAMIDHTATFSGFKRDNPLRGCGIINFYVPSSSYGVVEICHLMLLHSLLDL